MSFPLELLGGKITLRSAGCCSPDPEAIFLVVMEIDRIVARHE
jgi:hypothetical protein